MADKIKKGDWNAQTTAILLIVAPILVILFNSLAPVNSANAFDFGFSPDDIKTGMARMNQPIILRVITGTKKNKFYY